MNEIEEIFQKLNIDKHDYFLTGSRALDDLGSKTKISTDSSDYDYVLLIYHRHHIIRYLQDNKIEFEGSCYNGGFKFRLNNKIFNIITTIDIEFIAWKEALDIIKYILKNNNNSAKAIGQKQFRYCLYEQLRAISKMMNTIGYNKDH